jgi:demethylmenaquinone methyltransferase/2-methoxy-6-polyprenyl-1,4-benzoquinol methylase
MSPVPDRDPLAIRTMFGRIAPRYDLANRILSLGLDRGWRRATARELAREPAPLVLDLCSGTGDLTLEILRTRAADVVIACDFAEPMLALAEAKLRRAGLGDRCSFVQADALRLPFRDGGFDAVTVAFGIRNFSDLEAGLREMHRVLRAGGRALILEFSSPTRPALARAYRCYRSRLLPWLGGRITGHGKPYAYLDRSIASFDDPALLAGRLREAGFAAAGWNPIAAGIVCIHTAVKA